MSSCNKEIVVIPNITSDQTWTSNNDYAVNDDTIIDNGATLTIEPGTVIKSAAGKGLYVYNGTLIAEGTEEKPIVFTSSAKNPAKGAWVGLVFYEGTLNNTTLKYCEIEYAGGDQNYRAIHIYESKIHVNYCSIVDNKYNGIYLWGTGANFMSFTNNEIDDIDGHAIVMSAHVN